MKIPHRQSGQTLLLFAFTLLPLAMMVFGTLAIGQRIKDRTEAQMLADASAYSNAVSTARALNAAALLNRAAIASYVSLLADESMISYAGMFRGFQQGSGPLVKEIQKKPGCAGFTGAQLTGPPVSKNAWHAQDVKAGTQALTAQGAAGGFQSDMSAVVNHVRDKLYAQQYAKSILSLAYPLDSNRGGLEARAVLGPRGTGAHLGAALGASGRATLYAVMGTRGDPFVSNRVSGTPATFPAPGVNISLTFPSTGAGGAGFGTTGGLIPNEGGGTTSYGDAFYRAQKWGKGLSGVVAWAQDEGGTVTARVQCVPGGPFYSVTGPTLLPALVGSTARNYVDDVHFYSGSREDTPANSQQHTLGSCDPACCCPGVFGESPSLASMTPNPAAGPWGQPLTPAVIDRDYSKVPAQPWDFAFTFHFGKNGIPFYDGKAQATRFQVASATGIAYYHRQYRSAAAVPSNYAEPPNTFNPFWRATLVSSTLDPTSSATLAAAGLPSLMGSAFWDSRNVFWGR